jgi:hypothetical protein
MLKGFMRDVTLSLQARSGVTPAFFVWLAIVLVALVAAFAFLGVAGYQWLALQLGVVFGGLAMAGAFLLIALVGAIVCAILRQRARRRAMLERAARAQASSSWLLDPKILGIALEAGRTVGWPRIMAVGLLGFLAAQWLRESKGRNPDEPA